MNRVNPIRQRIKNKEVLIGTMFKINSPALAELMGYCGFDFIVIDTEHSVFSPVDTENIIRAADVAGMASIVRTRDGSPEEVLHALDSGADGVQIPSLTTIEAAQRACRSAKYYPEGDRGLSATQRGARYCCWDKEESYFSYANRHSLVVAHVENLEMAHKIDELLKIPQLDVIFVGPGDLSQSMGKPGQANDPEVVAEIEKIFKKVLASDKAVGIFCGGLANVEKYIDWGATYIAFGTDTTQISTALKQNVKAAKEFVQKKQL
ncbi:MAG: 2-dehydro-3-deoxyglucarate aldolase [Firmicutes bacterium]|nr:2-dehydro-3-deoxyglucarate aldolase [Bacillota bacterium]